MGGFLLILLRKMKSTIGSIFLLCAVANAINYTGYWNFYWFTSGASTVPTGSQKVSHVGNTVIGTPNFHLTTNFNITLFDNEGWNGFGTCQMYNNITGDPLTRVPCSLNADTEGNSFTLVYGLCPPGVCYPRSINPRRFIRQMTLKAGDFWITLKCSFALVGSEYSLRFCNRKGFVGFPVIIFTIFKILVIIIIICVVVSHFDIFLTENCLKVYFKGTLGRLRKSRNLKSCFINYKLTFVSTVLNLH